MVLEERAASHATHNKLIHWPLGDLNEILDK